MEICIIQCLEKIRISRRISEDQYKWLRFDQELEIVVFDYSFKSFCNVDKECILSVGICSNVLSDQIINDFLHHKSFRHLKLNTVLSWVKDFLPIHECAIWETRIHAIHQSYDIFKALLPNPDIKDLISNRKLRHLSILCILQNIQHLISKKTYRKWKRFYFKQFVKQYPFFKG